MAGTWDITLTRGETFRREGIRWWAVKDVIPVDMTGCGGEMIIYQNGQTLFTLNASNGRFTITDPPNARMNVLITKSDIDGFTWRNANHKLTLDLANGDTRILYKGKVEIQ